MTGRDLIIYILANDLEDEPLFKDGKFIGFISVEEAAVKFHVGMETVRTWVAFGFLDGVKVHDEIFIPMNAEPTIYRKEKNSNA